MNDNDVCIMRGYIAEIKDYMSKALRCMSIPKPDWDGCFDAMSSARTVMHDAQYMCFGKNDD